MTQTIAGLGRYEGLDPTDSGSPLWRDGRLNDTTIAERRSLLYWREQARVYEASNRIRGDKIEGLREELDASRRLSLKLWKRTHETEAERDEARAVARGLLAVLRIENEPDIGDLGMFTQLTREDWWRRKIAELGQLGPVPEWLDTDHGRS